jgi:glycosyltransferase involved in cell wall biosynthesis
MTKISAVVITLNEEKNIGRCIDSLEGVAEEIIVVDSFSSDNTENICKEKGVTFIKHEFEGYIEQKNWARQQASNTYVLSLDADEALSDKLKAEILKVKQNGFDYDGYYFNRKTNYCGKWINHSGWYPDRKLRLWNNKKGQWAGENPHDRFEMEEGAKIKYLEGDLLHYSFYTFEQHMDNVNKFTSITALMRYRKGKKFSRLKMLFSPIWKFILSYFLQKGFMDGYYGFVICINSAHANFLKQIKLQQLWKQNREQANKA